MSSLALRYARALVDAAGAELTDIFTELKQFQVMVDANPALAEIFANPTVALDQKVGLLTGLIARLKPRQTTSNFLGVLLRNQRLAALPAILESVGAEIDVRNGVVPVEVTTAQSLSMTDRRTLERRLKSMTGKDVRVQYKTEPELIGGVVTRIGSRYYDGSVRTQLNEFRTKLSRI
jgi:F-type H+-transporting ATPase subunit delta